MKIPPLTNTLKNSDLTLASIVTKTIGLAVLSAGLLKVGGTLWKKVYYLNEYLDASIKENGSSDDPLIQRARKAKAFVEMQANPIAWDLFSGTCLIIKGIGILGLFPSIDMLDISREAYDNLAEVYNTIIDKFK